MFGSEGNYLSKVKIIILKFNVMKLLKIVRT
jgi:hypothetical protein